MSETAKGGASAAVGTRQELTQRLTDFPVRSQPLQDRRAAAVVLAVYESGDELGFWLTRRTSKLRDHPGQFALPGGRLEPGETAEVAGLRELQEELGISLAAADVMGRLDDYPTRSGYVMTPIVCWAGQWRAPTPSPDEIGAVFELSLSDVAVEPRFLSIPESDRPVIQLPLLGNNIHAPTAAVIYQFAELACWNRITRVDQLEQPVFAWR